MISLISSLVFAAWSVAVAVCDCRSRRVPNLLVGAGLCAALAASCLHAGPAHLGILHALAAAAVGLAALMPFFVLGMMGAADVKVFAVLGAWCGMPALVDLWIVASIVALVHSFVMLTIVRNRSHTVTERFGDGVTSGSSGLSGTSALSGVSGKRRGAPYAAFLTVPALVWLAIQMTPGGLQ